MKSNKSENKSKINTHSLKAKNFRFLIEAQDEFEDLDIVDVPMDFILANNNKHQHCGKHILVYVLDKREVANKVVVSSEEIESVVKQVHIELGGAPVEFLKVLTSE